ncbi:putative transcription elongation factor SPT5 homolog 1 [Physcomitrium patens]|uniref:Transcription elongation factor SPT5 n=1 Tax=Physcomitrium patens TaxID=3218 RepID=A0A2K1IE81_PHYPA|nr:putative transcription elongation factor SPT5 homolog 1 isoform X2 [Physcomitrium patens]PNR27589.1 hypothetical protein PHYPA_029741 [Physcomitrium patens]|eukprot:XP_024365722.1 putative transcription elongation factor SPT5 homolog 1 isoform X2 [Physcomitrella patens]
MAKHYDDDDEAEEVDEEEAEAEEVEEEEEEDGEDLEEEEEEEEEERGRKRKYKGSQFIDDVAEEDDDEDEEDEAPRKRRQHRRGLEFIDDTAAVASDEDEEEEEEEEDFIERGDVSPGAEEIRRPHHRAAIRDDAQEDVEGLERYIQQRYGRQEYEKYDEAETTEVEQQALLPSVKDPKLWMVKCNLGHEREAAICLMQKYIDQDQINQPLLIKSAIALDHLKGYLYIESEKEAYVRQACRGMRMIYSQKVTLVPIKEMTDVVSVEKKLVEIDQDTWVRVKIGIYKGDLAKVVDVDHVRQRAQIKLIPRIDLQALAAKLEGRDDMKKRPRPAPRFISIQDVKDLRIPVERKRDGSTGELFDQFGGMMFKDGYLYKYVSLKTIDAKGVEPSLDELQRFQKPGEDGMDALGLPPSAIKNRGKFMKGDAVVVIEGDLRNLMGVVEKVDDDNVYIVPKYKDLKETLVFKEKQLQKFFKTGDHVKVIAGNHDGATGMIVKVQNNVITLLSDTTREDLRVFAHNIVESSEVTSGITKLGDYELHDLVALDHSTVGLIVRVEKDVFQILKGNPERIELLMVKPRDIRRKVFDRKVNTQDRDMNVISLKDVVRVLDGQFKGKQGPVEHIHRGLLFIHDRHHLENGGYVCIKARQCTALGGSRNGSDRRNGGSVSNLSSFGLNGNVLQSPRRDTPFGGHGGGGGRGGGQLGGGYGGGRGGGGGRGRREDSIVGRSVKIRLGPFKGYRGRVKDATDSTVRIELESQMKVVTVRREQLSDPGESQTGFYSNHRESPRYGAGSETPMHPSRTPMHHPAFMTPMRDPNFATPSLDGMRTPMRDRAWNPHTPMTPHRGNNWDDANPSTWDIHTSTPQYEPGTPGGRPFEAPTPGNGWSAQTPGASFSEAGTPTEPVQSYAAPSPYLPGTPGGPPMTPGVPSYLPGTPGGQPMTPGTGGLDPTSPAIGSGGGFDYEGGWVMPDIVVTIRKIGEETQTAVIREVLPDGSCRVALGPTGDGDILLVGQGDMDLVLPKKTDKIKIVSGEHRGCTGKLMGIDGADGIVRLDDTLDVRILDMSSLSKIST